MPNACYTSIRGHVMKDLIKLKREHVMENLSKLNNDWVDP